VLRCSVSDSTGDTQQVRLVVDEWRATKGTNICDETVQSSSTTITCYLPNHNRTYGYRFYAIFADGTEYTLDSGSVEFARVLEWGTSGILMTLFLFLTLGAVGIYKPELSLILGGSAILISSALNILSIEIGGVAGIIVVIAILVYRMGGNR
jgi:hypothetical protein